MNEFLHSGQIGDVIYSLPTIRALGGGILYLAPGNRPDSWFPREVAERMGTLLRSQCYLHDVRIWDTHRVPEFVLDKFRDGDTTNTNLADCHLRVFGLPQQHRDTAWLDVPPLRLPGKEVVFQRTPRNRNPAFSWQRIYQEYGQRAVLVGYRNEHAEFEATVGPIDCFVARDTLEMASLIRGASLFVGNQSCGYALAEAMHHPRVILEVCPAQPVNIFGRAAVKYCWIYP